MNKIIFSVLIVLIGGFWVFGTIMNNMKVQHPPQSALYKGQNSMAIWEWRSLNDLSLQEVEEINQKLEEQGVRTIYLSIGDGVDLLDTDQNESAQNKLAEYNKKLESYINIAKKNNLEVHGLAGGPLWSDSSQRYLTDLAVKFVVVYNKSVSEESELAGLQFDIEPFNSQDFESDKNQVIIDYIQMVSDVVELFEKEQGGDGSGKQIEVGFALPYWLDGQNGNIPKTVWKGQEKFAVYQVADELSRYSNSYIVLMAYRNVASGEGGTISISEKQIANLSKSNPKVKVIVGQELNNEEPAKITFYGKSKAELVAELNKINNAFNHYSNYGGIALHEVSSFLDLR